jgi:hypothetical protein
VFVLSRPVSAIEAQTVLSIIVSIIVMMRPLLIYYCRSRRPSYAEADIRVKIYGFFCFVLSTTRLAKELVIIVQHHWMHVYTASSTQCLQL